MKIIAQGINDIPKTGKARRKMMKKNLRMLREMMKDKKNEQNK